MKWGKPRETIPSRFLFEMTGQAESPKAIERFEAACRVNPFGDPEREWRRKR